MSLRTKTCSCRTYPYPYLYEMFHRLFSDMTSIQSYRHFSNLFRVHLYLLP